MISKNYKQKIVSKAAILTGVVFLFAIILVHPGYSQPVSPNRSAAITETIKKGDSAFRIEKYKDALELYDSAVSQNPALLKDQSVTARRAMCAYHLGRYETAIEQFAEAKSQGAAYPDYIDYYASMAAMKTGDYSSAAESFSEIPVKYPASFVKNEASYRAGYLYNSLGRFAESTRLLQPLENARNIEAGRSAVRYYIADNYMREGNTASAIPVYLRLLERAASDTFALKSAERIRDIRRSSNSDLTERETVYLSSVYAAHSRTDEAMDLLEEYFVKFPVGENRGRAYFEKGKIHYTRRQYREAVSDFNTAFETLREPGLIRESRLYIARSYSRIGDRASAEKEYDRFAREYPGDRRAAESMWIIALNHERAGNLLKASQEYRKISEKPEPNSYKERALFRTGYTLYKNDYLTRSSQYYNGLQKQYPQTNLALQASFWEAKALEKLGKTEAAAGIFSRLAQSKRRNYYAIVSREKAGHTVQFVEEPGSLDIQSIPNGLLEVVETGLIFGEPWGSRELQRYRRGVSVLKESLIALYRALVEMGTYHEAVRLADLLYNRYYYGSNNAEVLRWLYPKPFSDYLRGIPDASRVDENLIFGIMRRESLFELKVESSAGALGLMQLMPQTAESLARTIGIQGFSLSEIYKPEINMSLGIRNVRDLMQRFRRNLPLVLAAYNAGDTAVRRWIDRYGTNDMDEFIENIEYSETRTFVKEVLKNYYFYNQLYQEETGRN